MREQTPDHFCNKNRNALGEGHYVPIYDPIEHRVKLEYRDPNFWERERLKEIDKGRGAYMAFLFVGVWIAAPLCCLIQPSSYWGAGAIYYASTLLLAFLRFTVFMSLDNDGRMSGKEELLHAPWRIVLATLLWPIFLLTYQNIFKPIGLVQQLRLEAAWRKRHKIWRPLTDDQRRQIEDMWLNGYEEALAELEATVIGWRAPTACYLIISLVWLTMPSFEAHADTAHSTQIEKVSDSSLIISSRDGPTSTDPIGSLIEFADIPIVPELPAPPKVSPPIPESEKGR